MAMPDIYKCSNECREAHSKVDKLLIFRALAIKEEDDFEGIIIKLF